MTFCVSDCHNETIFKKKDFLRWLLRKERHAATRFLLASSETFGYDLLRYSQLLCKLFLRLYRILSKQLLQVIIVAFLRASKALFVD